MQVFKKLTCRTHPELFELAGEHMRASALEPFFADWTAQRYQADTASQVVHDFFIDGTNQVFHGVRAVALWCWGGSEDDDNDEETALPPWIGCTYLRFPLADLVLLGGNLAHALCSLQDEDDDVYYIQVQEEQGQHFCVRVVTEHSSSSSSLALASVRATPEQLFALDEELCRWDGLNRTFAVLSAHAREVRVCLPSTWPATTMTSPAWLISPGFQSPTGASLAAAKFAPHTPSPSAQLVHALESRYQTNTQVVMACSEVVVCTGGGGGGGGWAVQTSVAFVARSEQDEDGDGGVPLMGFGLAIPTALDSVWGKVKLKREGGDALLPTTSNASPFARALCCEVTMRAVRVAAAPTNTSTSTLHRAMQLGLGQCLDQLVLAGQRQRQRCTLESIATSIHGIFQHASPVFRLRVLELCGGGGGQEEEDDRLHALLVDRLANVLYDEDYDEADEQGDDQATVIFDDDDDNDAYQQLID